MEGRDDGVCIAWGTNQLAFSTYSAYTIQFMTLENFASSAGNHWLFLFTESCQSSNRWGSVTVRTGTPVPALSLHSAPICPGVSFHYQLLSKLLSDSSARATHSAPCPAASDLSRCSLPGICHLQRRCCHLLRPQPARGRRAQEGQWGVPPSPAPLRQPPPPAPGSLNPTHPGPRHSHHRPGGTRLAPGARVVRTQRL